MSGEGETENLLLSERFETLFLIDLLTNLQPGDVAMPKLPPKQADMLSIIFQTALTLKGDYTTCPQFYSNLIMWGCT